MRLAIVGSRSFTEVAKVKAVLEKYMAQYGDDLVVVSGGAKGADSIAKELATRNGIAYAEFPPAHEQHNEHCVLPPDHYGQPYKVGNFFDRNGLIAEYAGHVAAFVVEGVKCNGTMDTVNKSKALGKPTFVFAQTGF